MCTTIKDDPSKFTYFESHAGDGRAEFDDGETEPGSALIAASNSKQCQCIFMEYSEDNYLKLKETLNQKDYPNVKIIHGNSNNDIELVLNNVPKYYHSLGLIDPYAPNDLKWKTIETIASHSYTNKRGFIRRPELIINFPIMGIKRNAGFLDKKESITYAEKNCKIIDDFFGDDKWRNIWRKYHDSPEESQKKLVELYVNNLKPFYTFVYPLLLIEDVKTKSPLYYLVTCSQHKLGDKFLTDLKTRIESWTQEEFIRDLYSVKIPIEGYDDSKPQISLDDFF